MSFDIYGNNLAKGHCEVHPHVAEEYPCGMCDAEIKPNQSVNRIEELEYHLALCNDHITELEKERDALYKSQQAAISMKARAEMLNIIMLGMIDPEIEADEKVCGSDWDYVDDETYKNWVQLLQAHNLEQQLKSLKEYANINGILRQEPSTRSLHEKIMELEGNQEALKEQGE